jgi:hypothetical protein
MYNFQGWNILLYFCQTVVKIFILAEETFAGGEMTFN